MCIGFLGRARIPAASHLQKNTTVEGYGSNDLNLDLLFMRKLQNNSAFPVGHGSDRTASSFSFQRAPNCDADNLNEMEWREMTVEGGGRLDVTPTDPNHEE